MYPLLLFLVSMLLIGAGVVAGAPALFDEGKPQWTLLVPALIVLVSGIATLLFAVHALIG